MDEEPPRISGVPGADPEPRGGDIGLWIQLGVAVVVTIALAFFGLGFIINAVGAHRPGRGSAAANAVGAAVCLALLVLSLRFAVRVEHRLRRRQPVAQAFEVNQRAQVTRAPGRGGRHGRRYGPVGTGVTVAVLVAGAIGFAVGAVSSHAQGVRSSYVQHHGTAVTAIVDSVVNTQHCSRGGCDYTAAIPVTLSLPVGGTRLTVVHYPGYSGLVKGDEVTVLVDSKQPGYAELPGAPFGKSWPWILLLLFALVFAALAVRAGILLRRQLVHRSAHLARTGAGVAAGSAHDA